MQFCFKAYLYEEGKKQMENSLSLPDNCMTRMSDIPHVPVFIF